MIHVVLATLLTCVYSVFVGLEDIEVTIQQNGYKPITFHGTLSTVPHSSHIIAWSCDELNLQELKKQGDQKQWIIPVVLQGKGIVIPFSSFKKRLSLEKNERRLNHLILSGNDQGNQLTISFLSSHDRERIYEIIELIQASLEAQTKLPSEDELENYLQGMDAYLGEFCRRHERKDFSYKEEDL